YQPMLSSLHDVLLSVFCRLYLCTSPCCSLLSSSLFFTNLATTEFYNLSLHDALPILLLRRSSEPCARYSPVHVRERALHHCHLPATECRAGLCPSDLRHRRGHRRPGRGGAKHLPGPRRTDYSRRCGGCEAYRSHRLFAC